MEDVAAGEASRNGKRQFAHSLNLALSLADLQRASNISVDLQVRDASDRVLHQVRDIQWSLEDLGSLQDVLLQLEIELEREDS